MKAKAAAFYRDTVDDILQNLLLGRLLHVDETQITTRSGELLSGYFATPNE